MRFQVAGIRFRLKQWKEAQVQFDDLLVLTPEPENEYDHNAVKVSKNGVHFGYVPRAYSAEVTALLKENEVACRVDAIIPDSCWVDVRPLGRK